MSNLSPTLTPSELVDALRQRSRQVQLPYLLLQYSLAIVYIWFGALKPLGLSPANELVTLTIPWLEPEFFVPFLGYWEVAIGVAFLTRSLLPHALVLMGLQMFGTLLPLVLLPHICFSKFPFVLTLEGQYIIKNLVFISAAIAVAANLRRQHTIVA